jgi:hypothetical protein
VASSVIVPELAAFSQQSYTSRSAIHSGVHSRLDDGHIKAAQQRLVFWEKPVFAIISPCEQLGNGSAGIGSNRLSKSRSIPSPTTPCHAVGNRLLKLTPGGLFSLLQNLKPDRLALRDLRRIGGGVTGSRVNVHLDLLPDSEGRSQRPLA